MILLRRLAPWLVCLWLAACAGLGPLREPPSVTLADIDVAEIGLLEQTLILRLRVQNPNDSEFDIDGIAYQLEVNGKPFARGVGNKKVRVPRYGVAVIETEAVSGLVKVLRQLDRLGGGESASLSYRLSGHLSAGSMGYLPFDYTGQLTLPGFVDFNGK